jgi:hypothetical protein
MNSLYLSYINTCTCNIYLNYVNKITSFHSLYYQLLLELLLLIVMNHKDHQRSVTLDFMFTLTRQSYVLLDKPTVS